jgi:hypothetical protein
VGCARTQITNSNLKSNFFLHGVMVGNHWRRRALAGFGISSIGIISFALFQQDDDSFQEIKSRTEKSVAQLPEVSVASKTEVLALRNLLSPAEVECLLKTARKIRPLCGQMGRDANGVRVLANAPWETRYLHTNGVWKRETESRNMVKKIVDAGWNAMENSPLFVVANSPSREEMSIRCVELHEVGPGGALPDPDHFDGGSVITIDVMLSSIGDFDGGEFCTPIVGAVHDSESHDIKQERLCAHPFNQGDALVFLSHKRHCVQPVTAGIRKVLVIELWCGEERQCAHRCESHWGACDHTLLHSTVLRLMTGGGIEA